MPISSWRPIVGTALGAGVALAVACGSASDGSAVAPGIQATFLADRSSPESASVSLVQAATAGDLVTVHASVTDVAGLYGAGFYLTVDPAIVAFVRYAPGDVLETGGHSPVYLVDASQPGLIVVSTTRLGAVPAVDVTGTRTLLSLTFRGIGVGACHVTFHGAALYGDQLQPQPMPGIRWYGGEFVGG